MNEQVTNAHCHQCYICFTPEKCTLDCDIEQDLGTYMGFSKAHPVECSGCVSRARRVQAAKNKRRHAARRRRLLGMVIHWMARGKGE